MQKVFQYGTKHYLSSVLFYLLSSITQTLHVCFTALIPSSSSINLPHYSWHIQIKLSTFKFPISKFLNCYVSYCILPSATLLQTASEHHDLPGCFPPSNSPRHYRSHDNPILLGMKERLAWLQNSAFQSGCFYFYKARKDLLYSLSYSPTLQFHHHSSFLHLVLTASAISLRY